MIELDKLTDDELKQLRTAISIIQTACDVIKKHIPDEAQVGSDTFTIFTKSIDLTQKYLIFPDK